MWSETKSFIDKTRIGIVFLVVSFNEVFQMIERLARTVDEFDDRHLHNVDLQKKESDVI